MWSTWRALWPPSWYAAISVEKKKESLITRIWILWNVGTHQFCFLSINGKAGRRVWGAAPEVPGEGHRPAYVCAKVQEAPHGVSQAGLAPSRRSDITSLMSCWRDDRWQLCCILARSFLFYTLVGPVLYVQLIVGLTKHQTENACIVMLFEMIFSFGIIVRDILAIHYPADWPSWIDMRWSNPLPKPLL